jgi:transcriptional regulator with XRE-family HTH domain
MDAVQREGVGARIRELRDQRGWSQAKLAETAGVSARTVYTAEKGHDISSRKLRAILDALGVERPENGDIVIEDMPEDVGVFLRVAAQRLSVLSPEERKDVLMELYPKLLGTIRRGTTPEE